MHYPLDNIGRTSTKWKSMKRSSFLIAAIIVWLLSTSILGQNLIVTSREDTGMGTLREAVIKANNQTGPDTIKFEIQDPTDGETGVVSLLSPLPAITDPDLVIIGGVQIFDENLRYAYLPTVWINGSEISVDTAIGFTIRANNVELRHLTIIGFSGGGILFDGVEGGRVFGCYVGFLLDDGDKRTLNNGQGIAINASTNIFIGPSEIPPLANIISGYGQNGITISDSSFFNIILGNYLGINPGTVHYFSDGHGENGISISNGSRHNEVLDNHIGQSQSNGIMISASNQNVIFNNFVGTDEEFSQDYGNQGSGIRLVSGASDNLLVNNHIGYNHSYGILNEGNQTTQNLFSRNSISKNIMGGINNSLGGNLDLQPPVLQMGANREIRGTAAALQIIEFFFDEGMQGRFYIDSMTVGVAGSFSMTIPAPPGDLNLTATTRDSVGNTSVFSEPIKLQEAGAINTVTTTADSGTGSFRWAITSANSNPGPDTIRFNIPKSDSGFDSVKGIWIIRPDTPYAAILDEGLFIDGPSQANFIGQETNQLGPEIVISGQNEGSFASCLNTHAAGTEIYGLTINSFKGSGINIYRPGHATISGCYIGTTYDGLQKAGNNDGIVLGYQSTHSFVGPTTYYPFGNVISGNNRIGIFVVDSSMHNVIVGNNIGVNSNNSDTIGNRAKGLSLERSCHFNEIFDNNIAGNFIGIFLVESQHNVIANNFIGNIGGSFHLLGNEDAGIFLFKNSHQNKIVENILALNGTYGIYNDGFDCVQNLFSRNGFLLNKIGDIRNVNGGNLELPPPDNMMLTGKILTGGGTAHHVIELYSDPGLDGKQYLDSVLIGENGTFRYVFDEDPFFEVFAIMRDTAGNTSEFSAAASVTTSSELNTYRSITLEHTPNPANDEMVIFYGLPEATHVSMSLINLQGDFIKEINNSHQPAGDHTVLLNLSEVPSGTYFYSFQTSNGITAVAKFIVIR